MGCGTVNTGKWWWLGSSQINGWFGRKPTPRQKRLRGKIVKTHHGKLYKRVLHRAHKEQQNKNNRKAGENIRTPQENNKKRENRVENLERKKEELEREIESRQECDSKHASIG